MWNLTGRAPFSTPGFGFFYIRDRIGGLAPRFPVINIDFADSFGGRWNQACHPIVAVNDIRLNGRNQMVNDLTLKGQREFDVVP